MYEVIVAFVEAGGGMISEVPRPLALLVPLPRSYHIPNLKKSAWMLPGFVLDICLTRGGVTMVLAALGVVGAATNDVSSEWRAEL